jgi:hypothetical protein
MNKYLMLSAAAVLASTGANASGVHSFQFGTAYGGSYCDGGTAYTGVDGGANSGAVRAWIHTNNNCASGTSQGIGLLGKIAGLGKTSVMSDTLYGKNYADFTVQLSFALPKKFKAGQPWTLWVGFSGTTNFEGNHGPLINVSPGRHMVKGHSTKSTTALVKQLIAARSK